MTKANQRRVKQGRKMFREYCEFCALPAIERKQYYTATDLITDVLHFAASKGWDAHMILNDARGHFDAESSGEE